jgi:hypothetical protein
MTESSRPGTTLQWHGHAAYAQCGVCRQLVRVNKPGLGSLHFCLNKCQQTGWHVAQKTRRRGPFWARRDERYCAACLAVDTAKDPS